MNILCGQYTKINKRKESYGIIEGPINHLRVVSFKLWMVWSPPVEGGGDSLVNCDNSHCVSNKGGV